MSPEHCLHINLSSYLSPYLPRVKLPQGIVASHSRVWGHRSPMATASSLPGSIVRLANSLWCLC